MSKRLHTKSQFNIKETTLMTEIANESRLILKSAKLKILPLKKTQTSELEFNADQDTLDGVVQNPEEE